MAGDMSFEALNLARQGSRLRPGGLPRPRWTPPEREALEAAQRAIWQARDIVLNDLDKPTRRQGKRAGLDVRICTSKAVKTPERELFLSANAKRAKARERAELLAALRAGLAERAT